MEITIKKSQQITTFKEVTLDVPNTPIYLIDEELSEAWAILPKFNNYNDGTATLDGYYVILVDFYSTSRITELYIFTNELSKNDRTNPNKETFYKAIDYILNYNRLPSIITMEQFIIKYQEVTQGINKALSTMDKNYDQFIQYQKEQQNNQKQYTVAFIGNNGGKAQYYDSLQEAEEAFKHPDAMFLAEVIKKNPNHRKNK